MGDLGVELTDGSSRSIPRVLERGVTALNARLIHALKPSEIKNALPPTATTTDETRDSEYSAGLVVVADFDGERVQAAADALHAAGYENVVAVEGGYNGWRKIFTTCGRRRPPQGKWVSTGAGGESLKSGLTLDPNVAAAYEENWGKPPPKHGEKGESVAASQRPNPALAPIAMDADIVEARQRAIDNGHAASNGGAAISGAAEGSAWDTFFTDDANRTPYYVNRNTGEKRWEEPERWWSGGKWVDRG